MMKELRKMAKASSIEELASEKSNPRKMAKASSIEEQTKNLETSTEEVAMLYQFQGLFLFCVKKRLFRVKILT